MDINYESFTEAGNYRNSLQHPCSLIISGPSNCGKTHFVSQLIENAGVIFSVEIQKIVYLYSCWQPAFDQLLKMRDITFIQGIPKSLADDEIMPIHTNTLLIIDDLMEGASKNLEVQNVFTQYVHHRNMSCIYLMQNLFTQGKASRTISLNTNYMVLFKNSRDTYQISLLARQMYPGNTQYFLQAFADATSKPYGYLLVDFKAMTPDCYRLRTEILSDSPVVYMPKKLIK